MNIRKTAAALVALGLSLGLVGVGVGATFTDSASVVQGATVGSFGCTVSSTVPGAIVATDKHSVAFTAPDIQGSGQSSVPFPFTITATGSVGVQVHLTVALTNQGNTFSDMLNPSLTTGTQDVIIGPAPASHSFAGGLKWGSLDNSYLGKAVSITYTAACGEIVHGTNNNVFICTYVGTPGVDQTLTGIRPLGTPTNAAPGTWVQYPAGNTVGSLAYVVAYNDGQPQPPLSACPPPSNASTNATVHFWKTVDNTFGGTATPADWTMSLSDPSTFTVVRSGVDGQTVSVAPGAYHLDEAAASSVTQPYQSQMGGCFKDLATASGFAQDVTFTSGETWYCGFANQVVPATVLFSNTYPTTAPATPVAMHMTSSSHTYTDADGGFVDMVPGTYTVSQDLPAGYTADAGACTDLAGSGGTVGPTITVTNGDLWSCGFRNTVTP